MNKLSQKQAKKTKHIKHDSGMCKGLGPYALGN